MPSNLANMGISFNPVYMIREQFKDDMLLKHGLVDLKTGDVTNRMINKNQK